MPLVFKGMFKTSQEQAVPEIIEKRSFQKFSDQNWYEEGKQKASQLGGSLAALRTCLFRIFHDHKSAIAEDHEEQSRLKHEMRKKLKELLEKNQYYESRTATIKDVEIPKIQKEIEKIRLEIADIKENPKGHLKGVLNNPKPGFFIGCAILLFLTVYLFVFYSSASYSAFFKEYSLDQLAISNSIFDAKALTKALNDGLSELILIITIPSVFLGLGFLVHKFQEQSGWRKYPKIGLLILITFLFDAILAYEVTEKIYDLKSQNSFDSMEPYSLMMAMESVNFWLIIFAGFVVYLIWGFVFDFTMLAFGKFDRISVLINSKKMDIENQRNKISDFEDQVTKINYAHSKNQIDIEKLDVSLSHTIIDPKVLELASMNFLVGWLQYMEFENRPESDRSEANDLVTKFLSAHLESFKPVSNE